MDTEILKFGIMIMVLGMGTVYFFIILMIFFLNITTKALGIINKYFPEEVVEDKRNTVKKKTEDIEVAIAIACAAKQGGYKC